MAGKIQHMRQQQQIQALAGKRQRRRVAGDVHRAALASAAAPRHVVFPQQRLIGQAKLHGVIAKTSATAWSKYACSRASTCWPSGVSSHEFNAGMPALPGLCAPRSRSCPTETEFSCCACLPFQHLLTIISGFCTTRRMRWWWTQATPRQFRRFGEHQLTLAGVLITMAILITLAAYRHCAPTGQKRQCMARPMWPASPSRWARGESASLPGHGEALTVWATPGHTANHLSYLLPGAVFCGDTLFACGCGRVFDGTPTQLHASPCNAWLPCPTTQVCIARTNTPWPTSALPPSGAGQRRLAGALRRRRSPARARPAHRADHHRPGAAEQSVFCG